MAKPRISRVERTAIEAFIPPALRALNLDKWTVNLSDKAPPEEDGLEAHINPEEDSNSAELRLANVFFELPAEQQRATLTHELLHLISYRTTSYVATLEKLIAPPLWDHFWTELERKEDVMIEELTKLHIDQMPGLKLPRRSE